MSDAINILRSELRSFDYMFYQQVLSTPGLYSFWLRGQCLYVGMSIDLKRRIEEHSKNEQNVELKSYIDSYPNEIMISIVYLNYNQNTLLKLEAEAIKHLNPITNVLLTGQDAHE